MQCGRSRARVGINTGVGSESTGPGRHGRPAPHVLPLLASGEYTGALALTEPEAGSDVTSLLIHRGALGGRLYTLNGHKRYITLAPIADLVTALCPHGAGCQEGRRHLRLSD